MELSDINLLCFDLDDTLIPLECTSKLAYEGAIARHGSDLQRECCRIPSYRDFQSVQWSINASIGNSTMNDSFRWRTLCFRALLCPLGASKPLADNVAASYSAERDRPVALTAQVGDRLRLLREVTGVTLGILTNGYTELPPADMAHFGWIIRSCDIPYKKPSAEYFRLALDIMGRETQEVFYLTDAFSNDAQGAHAIGIQVGILSGNSEILPQGVHIIHCLDELVALFCGCHANELQCFDRRVLMVREGLKDVHLEPFIARVRQGQCRGIVWGGIETVDSRQVLLTRRARSDTWGFLSGEVEYGETWEAAAIREAHEELGLRCEHFTTQAQVTLHLSGEKLQIEVPGRLLRTALDIETHDIGCSEELAEARLFRWDSVPSHMFSQNEKLVPFLRREVAQ